MSKETHYVAQLRIERVDREVSENKSTGYRAEPAVAESKREVSEVTNLVIKGEELSRLLDKLGKHIALVEDDF